MPLFLYFKLINFTSKQQMSDIMRVILLAQKKSDNLVIYEILC